MAKSALIAGASGLVGSELLELLLEDAGYDRVISIGRRKLDRDHEQLEQFVVDFDRLEEHKDKLVADHVFCCLGTTMKKAGSREAFKKVDYHYPLNLAKLSAAQGAELFSVITAIGSDAKSFFFYNRVKGQLEQELGKIHGSAIQVIQPSMLLGERKELRLGERFGQLMMAAANVLMAGPLKKYKAIEAEQVARAMINFARDPGKGLQRYPNNELLEA